MISSDNRAKTKSNTVHFSNLMPMWRIWQNLRKFYVEFNPKPAAIQQICSEDKVLSQKSRSLITHLGTTGQGLGPAAPSIWGVWCCGGAQCGGSARASGRSARAELRLHPVRSHAPQLFHTGLFQKTTRRSCPQSQGPNCGCTEVYQDKPDQRRQDTWGTRVAWGIKNVCSSLGLWRCFVIRAV